MNKFGFNINLKNTPEEILELGETCLKSGDYGAIEVTYYEDMDGVDTFAYNSAIRQLVEKYHPQVTVHLPAFNFSEENSVIRSAILHEVENCCKYVAGLGGNEIVIHSGFLSSGMHVPIVNRDAGGKLLPVAEQTGKAREESGKFKKAWGLTVKLMKLSCMIAKQYGVTVYTENLNMDHLTTESKELNRLIDQVDEENLKIVFDIGHCHHTGHDIVEDVLEAGKRLKHLHLHDNRGDGDSHLPIGEGDIDYKAFTQALQTVGYQGLYMMELSHCDPENLRVSRERLMKCLE